MISLADDVSSGVRVGCVRLLPEPTEAPLLGVGVVIGGDGFSYPSP